jgi:hypothetical protein
MMKLNDFVVLISCISALNQFYAFQKFSFSVGVQTGVQSGPKVHTSLMGAGKGNFSGFPQMFGCTRIFQILIFIFFSTFSKWTEYGL